MLGVCFGVVSARFERHLLAVVSRQTTSPLNSCHKNQIVSRHQQLQAALADYWRWGGLGGTLNESAGCWFADGSPWTVGSCNHRLL